MRCCEKPSRSFASCSPESSSTGRASTSRSIPPGSGTSLRFPVPIATAVSGERSVEMFAPLADHLIAVEPNKDLVDAWHDARRATGLPGDVRVIGQIPICWDPDRDAAIARAHDQFRWFAGRLGGQLRPADDGRVRGRDAVRASPKTSPNPSRAARISTRSSTRSASTGRPASPTSRWCRSATRARSCSSRRRPDRCWRSCEPNRSERGLAMPRGQGIYDDESADEPKGGRPGPTDRRPRRWHGDAGERARRRRNRRGADRLTSLGGASAFAAAPVGRTPKIAEPAEVSAALPGRCAGRGRTRCRRGLGRRAEASGAPAGGTPQCPQLVRCRNRLRPSRFDLSSYPVTTRERRDR